MGTGADIYLLRHGETEWNAAGRFQGRLDSPLTPKGVGQAIAMGRTLAGIVPGAPGVAIHISPLGRARQTAEIIRGFRDGACRFDPRLREVTLGSWDGLAHDDIDARWPGLLDGSSPFDWFFRSPDGESYQHASLRVRAWLREANGIIIAVSHGLVGRLIRGAYLDLTAAEALALPVPQDVIWRLRGGAIQAIKC